MKAAAAIQLTNLFQTSFKKELAESIVGIIVDEGQNQDDLRQIFPKMTRLKF